jgi:hypothetical protein
MSHIIEKIVVGRWLRLAIVSTLIADQFAFRPIGSTICVHIYFMNHITRLLENNSYVRCLMTDFSTEFDRVSHEVLLEKLSRLPQPDCIFKWLISFLTNQSPSTKCLRIKSSPLSTNLSITHGSRLRPIPFFVLESNLKASSSTNTIFKNSVDTNLLVHECPDAPIQEEFGDILKLAAANKMTIIIQKTKEIVFRHPNPKIDLHLLCTEIVNKVELLGVIFTNNFHFHSHINYLSLVCSQRS